ncbi:MAG: M48 family metallopeptidase [Rickettsiaceae bacterium]
MKNVKNTEPTFITLDRLGDHINVLVRYSCKAKRIFIKIQHKNVELVLPNKNLHAGYKFLLEKEFWIRRKLRNSKITDHVGVDSKTISLLGKQYLLLKVDSIRNNVQIKENIIYIESLLSAHNKTLIKFLQNKLLLEITNIASLLGKKHNFKFSEIKIINSKNKWGSCSSKLVLSFNWRLVFAPLEILNYVIIHEMCHLIEMNHSKSFWNLVANLCPEYKSAKLWLKENGFRLHQYLQI